MTDISFITLLCIYGTLSVLHELEEWNINDWLKRNFINIESVSQKGTHIMLIILSIGILGWTTIAILLGNPLTAWVILPLVTFTFVNTFQHFYWQSLFRGRYAPGIITAIFNIPLTVEIMIQALQHNYIPVWYLIILAVLFLVGVIQTIICKNTFVPHLKSLMDLSVKIGNKFSEK